LKSLKDIKSILGNNREKLFKLYPIKSLAIFGSFARNQQQGDSDLDIIVEFDDKIGIGFIDLANELENLIGLKIDLVSKNGIKKRYFQSLEEELIYV
jgi:hypothetical protein